MTREAAFFATVTLRPYADQLHADAGVDLTVQTSEARDASDRIYDGKPWLFPPGRIGIEDRFPGDVESVGLYRNPERLPVSAIAESQESADRHVTVGDMKAVTTDDRDWAAHDRTIR
jgi:hypothetical protein